MKISNEIRSIHFEANKLYTKLSKVVSDEIDLKIIKPNKGWFFLDRLKKLESFALKLETGKVSDPRYMEDFFACTIVVPTTSQISHAENVLKSMYDIKERRPKFNKLTHQEAFEFSFDDLRLYLSRRTGKSGRHKNLSGIIFEVQIKTILQHAWSVASHDLIYKTNDVSWSKERIAYQIKATLEHAEIAIEKIDRLAKSSAISKKTSEVNEILIIIRVVKNFWPKYNLPMDIRRLAKIIHNILNICELKANQLQEILIAEKIRYTMLPSNLSPYSFFIQAMANSSKIDFEKKILGIKNVDTKILIHKDMDLPKWMKKKNKKIIYLKF